MFSFDLLVNAVVAGILLGGFYAAVSLGISVTFGLLDVANIAHPVFIIAGAYAVYAAEYGFCPRSHPGGAALHPALLWPWGGDLPYLLRQFRAARVSSPYAAWSFSSGSCSSLRSP